MKSLYYIKSDVYGRSEYFETHKDAWNTLRLEAQGEIGILFVERDVKVFNINPDKMKDQSNILKVYRLVAQGFISDEWK